MSFVDGNDSVNPRVHFEAGVKDLTRLDKVRFINLFGSVQYGILYSVAYLIIGIGLHILFPPFIKSQPLMEMIGWILLQCIVIVILTFYVQKAIEAIPGLLSFFPDYFQFETLKQKGYIPYGVQEYKGDIASSIILIGTQYQLFEKIIHVTNEISRQFH